MHPKPALITRLEAQYELAFIGQEAETIDDAVIKDFAGYGRAEADRARYLLDAAGRIIGLTLRSSGLSDFPWLEEAALAGLQVLNLTENKLTQLSLPVGLTELHHLDVSDNPELATLTLSTSLPKLTYLDASDSGLTAFALPAGCEELDWLDLSRNQLQQCDLPGALPKLRYLDLSGNEPLRLLSLSNKLTQLAYVHVSDCELEEMEFGGSTPALQTLDLRNNNLRELPAEVILNSPQLQTLYASGSAPRNISSPLINSQENALEPARLWFRELAKDPDQVLPNRTVKLLITGNGNVGKSTLICALKDPTERCRHEEPHDSTHGIETDFVDVDEVQFNYWDFGGQEIYHGTHRLFLTDEAVHLLVYDLETEALAREKQWIEDRVEKGGPKIRNRKLEYWYQVQSKGNERSKFLFAQNKYGNGEAKDERIRAFAADQQVRLLQIDAKNGHDIDGLKFRLRQLAKDLPAFGMLFPKSWLSVREYFAQNPKSAQPEKTLTRQRFFGEICPAHGVPTEMAELLLHYLNVFGYLYTHPKLEDTIIADQSWALEAIYRPLRRDDISKRFRGYRGKIPLFEVLAMFDDDQHHYSDADKQLFLDFMESCGLCFSLREDWYATGDGPRIELEADYVFPEYLRSEEPSHVTHFWQNNAVEPVKLKYQLAYTDYPAFQKFLCQLGRKTDLENLWRYGLHVSTEVGSFYVRLDYQHDQYEVLIEEKAATHWLDNILKELPIDDHSEWMQVTANGDLQSFETSEFVNRSLSKEGPQTLEQLPDRSVYIGKRNALFLVANPRLQKVIPYSEEYTAIQELIWDKSIQLVPKKLITFRDLNQLAMSKLQPEIIHFVGHGKGSDNGSESEGLIFHARDIYSEEIIGAKSLRSSFQHIVQNNERLRVVILNACYTESQARAISEAGLYVVGTEDKIGSLAAQDFAVGFYAHYLDHEDVEKAVRAGMANTSIEQGAYSLYHLFYEGSEISL